MGQDWSGIGVAALAVGALAGCGDPTQDNFASETLQCLIPQNAIVDGGPGKDGIPALTNPRFVAADDGAALYLQDVDRVMGIVVDNEPHAVPLNIQWWHEVVNVDFGTQQLAVTHCPLTGSSIVFDRAAVGGAAFGISGLLFMNNMLMYDRTGSGSESLWPQMTLGARCGPKRGTQLTVVPSIEMTWAGWRALHPDTRVVSQNTGHVRNYTASGYPYGAYDETDNNQIGFPVPHVDRRRPLKERILGIPDGAAGGIAFPFGALDALGAVGAVHTDGDGRRVVVFWDRARQAAAAYIGAVADQALTFTSDGERITDQETGSAWRIDGLSTAGSLAGARLTPVAEAFVAFWFAWAVFYPDTDLWTDKEGTTS